MPLDYIAVVRPETLEPLPSADPPVLLALAIRLWRAARASSTTCSSSPEGGERLPAVRGGGSAAPGARGFGRGRSVPTTESHWA